MKKLAAHWRSSKFTRADLYFHRLSLLTICALLSVAFPSLSSSQVPATTTEITNTDGSVVVVFSTVDGSTPGSDLNPVFDDSAITSGTYRPANSGAVEPPHTCCGIHCRLNLFT